MSKRNHRKAKEIWPPPRRARKCRRSPSVSRRPYWIAVTFWITRNASVTVNGLSRPSAFPGWQKPARRRAPQLTHLREAQYFSEHLHPAPAAVTAGFQPVCAGLSGVRQRLLEKRFSVTGKLLKLETSPAKYTRRGVDPSVYWFVQSFAEPHPFAPDSVFTCWSRISIKSCMGCRNICRRSTPRG